MHSDLPRGCYLLPGNLCFFDLSTSNVKCVAGTSEFRPRIFFYRLRGIDIQNRRPTSPIVYPRWLQLASQPWRCAKAIGGTRMSSKTTRFAVILWLSVEISAETMLKFQLKRCQTSPRIIFGLRNRKLGQFGMKAVLADFTKQYAWNTIFFYTYR